MKNLENVQGDERDVIYISTTYGPDPDSGVVYQRFGPINTDLGYRRLNVLFTRAKQQLRLFTSMKPDDVKISDPNTKRGRRVLHDYLEYAATGRLYGGENNSSEPTNNFELFVKNRLEARGFDVDCQVGVAGYFLDLAVSHPSFPNGYIAGVECDGATYHTAFSARDRDRLREEVLRNLGWDIYRVWSTDWFANPDEEIERLDRQLRELLRTKCPQDLSNNERRTNKQYTKETSVNVVPYNKTLSQESENVYVNIGDIVTYEELNGNKSIWKTYLISEKPSSPENGIINWQTAVASELINSEKGEKLTLDLPKGETKIVVREINKQNKDG